MEGESLANDQPSISTVEPLTDTRSMNHGSATRRSRIRDLSFSLPPNLRWKAIAARRITVDATFIEPISPGNAASMVSEFPRSRVAKPSRHRAAIKTSNNDRYTRRIRLPPVHAQNATPTHRPCCKRHRDRDVRAGRHSCAQDGGHQLGYAAVPLGVCGACSRPVRLLVLHDGLRHGATLPGVPDAVPHDVRRTLAHFRNAGRRT